MSWKEFNDWAEQENKKKGWWIPIAIALTCKLYFWQKHINILANQTKMKNIKGHSNWNITGNYCYCCNDVVS